MHESIKEYIKTGNFGYESEAREQLEYLVQDWIGKKFRMQIEPQKDRFDAHHQQYLITYPFSFTEFPDILIEITFNNNDCFKSNLFDNLQLIATLIMSDYEITLIKENYEAGFCSADTALDIQNKFGQVDNLIVKLDEITRLLTSK